MPASLWKSLIGRQETHTAEDVRPDPGFLRDHSLLSFYKVELRNDGVIIAEVPIPWMARAGIFWYETTLAAYCNPLIGHNYMVIRC